MTMSSSAIADAVRRLIDARRRGELLPGLPEPCRPQSLADGYRVQDAFIDAWGEAVAGWKIGCATLETQRMFGIDEPIYGPVFAAAVHASPAEIPAGTLAMRCLESEFAFRLGRDLAPRRQAYQRAEIVAALDRMILAIELIDTRFDRLVDYGAAAITADGAANGGLVLGDEIADWHGLDLAGHRVRLEVDGAVRAEGSGAEVLGHPLNTLVWLVERHTGRGHTLRAGEVISTGTCTGVTMVEPGAAAVADFGRLGRVAVRFAS